MQIHVVQPGDNVWLISRRYGVDAGQVIAANELPDPNRLAVGQALVIPTPGQETIHIVKQGESLWSIAQRYGTTVEAIMRLNPQATPTNLYPGQRLRIPVQAKPVIDVNAYTTQFGEEGAQGVRQVGAYLTYLCPFGYRIKNDGSLTPIDDQPLIAAAQSSRVVPLMSITNFSATESGSQLAHTVLSDADLQNTLLTNIVNTMQEKGYRGLNVDFENVYPDDREAYNDFMRLAARRMHENGFTISSALAPKTSSEQKGLLYEAHDYAAHGEIADFVVLMTYEWGYRFGPPQAISPINEIRRVLDYAVTVIPRNKILMGFQLYARDWLLPHVQGQQAETFDMQEAVRRAIRYGARIEYDPTSQSPHFRYYDANGRAHEVWFEDARSAQAKFDLVKEYNLKGISYWVLGYPFPQNWVLLAANFQIRKLT